MSNKTLYICDPGKNEKCTKEGCYLNGGPCVCTTLLENAKTDENGNPIDVSVTEVN